MIIKSACGCIVSSAEKSFIEKKKTGDANLVVSVGLTELISERYQQTPLLLIAGMRRLLLRIPFTPLVQELRSTILAGEKEKATEILFEKVDCMIRDLILPSFRMRWITWLFLANVLMVAAMMRLAN